MSINFREELRGISRGKDTKDIDWAKVAGGIEDEEEEEEVVEKLAPIKISPSEVLKRIRKPGKKSSGKAVINKKS